MTSIKSFSLLILLLIAISCSRPSENSLAHINSSEVKSFLEKALEKNGGLERWKAIKILKYNKNYELYLESGEVEMAAQQFHDYTLLPNMEINILSKEGNDKKQIVFEQGQIKEYVNDTLNKQVNEESLTNNMQSALFVISQPFKLADEGPELTYEGIKTLNTGEEVYVLRAVYNSSSKDNLTTSDTWWVYFDKESYLMTGYTVKHLDHYSLVRNIETIEVEGFHFPKLRKSWRVNEKGEVLYLRASYEYSNFEINSSI
ncbi:hypothetical protein [Fulvivirga lutimaris]|uniref:hypothetical protein n=1 Tax=Fulvivirga lutimaris TaxID=1819566 RepID=UPI0012BCFFEC|nr:hypothetical protein [Fulvivirga lutimaris]MTI40887.1 hypothetical protein [Fulvivirga lutimaris]